MNKSDCIFCKIANQEIDVPILYQNLESILIKDKNPMAPHHVLAISRAHHDNVDDACLFDSAILTDMFSLLFRYAYECGLDQSGYRILINTGKDAGQTVSHFHIHLLGGGSLKNDFGA